jgi:TATA-binding protein-associated factor Taf7
MYVKDSVIENQIERDLKKQRLEGMIEEVKHQLERAKDEAQRSRFENRVEKLRGELNLLSD